VAYQAFSVAATGLLAGRFFTEFPPHSAPRGIHCTLHELVSEENALEAKLDAGKHLDVDANLFSPGFFECFILVL
jgi:hypothetical protein